ncbi:MAG: YlmH/Sll1252 family protein, partial [Niameybacter sp.]
MNWMNIADQDEKHFLKMVTEYNEKSSSQYRMLATAFYNRDWMEEVLQRHGLWAQLEAYTFLGGHSYAERQVLAFGYEASYMDCPIVALKVTVKTGIGKPLGHRDFLGALLGLGIKRETIGDIISTDFG